MPWENVHLSRPMVRCTQRSSRSSSASPGICVPSRATASSVGAKMVSGVMQVSMKSVNSASAMSSAKRLSPMLVAHCENEKADRPAVGGSVAAPSLVVFVSNARVAAADSVAATALVLLSASPRSAMLAAIGAQGLPTDVHNASTSMGGGAEQAHEAAHAHPCPPAVDAVRPATPPAMVRALLRGGKRGRLV